MDIKFVVSWQQYIIPFEATVEFTSPITSFNALTRLQRKVDKRHYAALEGKDALGSDPACAPTLQFALLFEERIGAGLYLVSGEMYGGLC